MAVNPSPFGPKPQFMLATGLPASGYKLYAYAAGSSTKQNTYTDSTGGTANSNPITLNSLGQPSNEIWFTAGQSYKLLLTADTSNDPPQTSVWSVDNIDGINDTTVTQDQWVASGLTPTYVSATQFTLVGDQTTEFHVGRRLKTTNSGGTIYSRISVSAYTTLTTVTVVNDAGTLDSGLSAVSYGLLTATNHSIPVADIRLSGLTLVGNQSVTGQVSITDNTAPLTITSTDADAGVGPSFAIDRNSASPAANDVLGGVFFKGRDSGGNSENYADIYGQIIDPTAASEDGRLVIQTMIAGSVADRAYVGNGIYTVGATGGDQGANTVNATNFYKSGTVLPIQTSFTSAAQTITSAGALTIAHGLGAIPVLVMAFLTCTTTEANYAQGDILHIPLFSDNGTDTVGVSVSPNSTNLVVRYCDAANAFVVPDKTTGNRAALTNGNWTLTLRAFV